MQKRFIGGRSMRLRTKQEPAVWLEGRCCCEQGPATWRLQVAGNQVLIVRV